MAATAQASASPYYYWTDSQPVPYVSERRAAPRKPKAHHTQKPGAEKEAAKPQAPITVAVSVNKQQLKIYDANGLFAEAPVSTGMKGHSTPMGVFSVIQKQKFHRSNIYSGAPMPFMQRITWSGVALHAGVLPGYPASHGCIRMPPNFATRMYGWTRMGSRVLITPGEVTPSSFSHPLLSALKAPPSAAVQPETTPPATKSDKGAAVTATIAVATTDLRATIGHSESLLLADEALRSSRQMRTADAGTTKRTGATASDAFPSAAPARPEATDKPTAADLKPSVIEPTVKRENSAAKPSQAGNATQAGAAAAGGPAASPASAQATGWPEAKPAEAKIADQPTPVPSTTADAPAKPADANAPSKDLSRFAAPDKPIAPKPELKRNSQIAIFISRKDSKLYVRQNFAPVFSTPVTIAQGDKPLGTHVFSAIADKTDPAAMHWSVISLPASVRSVAAPEGAGKAVRPGKKPSETQAESRPVPQLSSPAEALDRITIPADVMAWLGEALSNGSSLIVSDQGIGQGETGEGTEFILSLR